LSVVFIIPLFFSLYYLLKDRQDLAFLNVYLPCLVFFPNYFAYRIPHLPPLCASAWALVPLGASLVFYPLPKLELRRMDLWVVLFILSFAASELLREASPKDGATMVAGDLMLILFPYIVGRRLIEPNLRVATVQRIVLIFACLTPFIFYEYRMGQNPWIFMGVRFFHLDVGPFVQIRDGVARVQASFGHAILAGIMFVVVFMLTCSLSDFYKRDKSRLGPISCWLERYHIPALLMILFLWLTRSRGPMLSGVAGYSILQIPKFRHVKLAGFVMALVLGLAGLAAYSFLDKYTSAADDGTLTEEQTSAMYRRELLKSYEPVIEQGGWLGWGALSVPEAGGQKSIDNGYLVIELAQGKLGLYVFLLIIAEGLAGAAYRAFTFKFPEPRVVAFTLLAALAGVFLSLTAVYLGEPVAPLAFLMLGWTQSLQDNVGSEPKFRFKRVFA
jgi:hypothetical protein